jgi:hypothetical protein
MSILALTSDTLTGTAGAGQIEYNGQFFGTDSAGSRAQLQRIVSATAVASTSGTSIDFTGIPAWVERITISMAGFSTNGASLPQIQIGSGSIDATSYTSSANWMGNSVAGPGYGSTTGFAIASVSGTNVLNVSFVLTLVGSNLWLGTNVGGFIQTGVFFTLSGGGIKTTSGTLDRVRITTVNGTDTFDAGSINIMYEG